MVVPGTMLSGTHFLKIHVVNYTKEKIEHKTGTCSQ